MNIPGTLPFTYRPEGPGEIVDAHGNLVATLESDRFVREEQDVHGELLARGAGHARVLVEAGAKAEEIADFAAATMNEYSSGRELTPQSFALALGTIAGLAVVLRDACRTELGQTPGGDPDPDAVDTAYYRQTPGEIPAPETGEPASLAQTPAGRALLAAAERVHDEDEAHVLLTVVGKPGTEGYSWVLFQGSWVRLCTLADQIGGALRMIIDQSKVDATPGKLAAIVASFARSLGCPIGIASVDATKPGPGRDTPKGDSPFFGARRMGNG